MEAGCGMWDVRNFNSGMRDENMTAGPGYPPLRRPGGGKGRV